MKKIQRKYFEVTTVLIFGFGKILITAAVWADNAPHVSRAIAGYLFFFFFQITPGG